MLRLLTVKLVMLELCADDTKNIIVSTVVVAVTLITLIVVFQFVRYALVSYSVYDSVFLRTFYRTVGRALHLKKSLVQ